MEKEKYVRERIDLHIAEYNALTSRCTSFISLQYALFAALVAWLTVGIIVFFEYKNPNAYLLIWGTLTGAQIFMMISSWSVYEQYVATLYLENKLKHRIRDLIGNDEFWEYESTLAVKRDHRIMKQQELFGLGFFFVSTLAFFIYRCTVCEYCIPLKSNSFYIDLFALLVNLAIGGIALKKTLVSLKVKREFLSPKREVQILTPQK